MPNTTKGKQPQVSFRPLVDKYWLSDNVNRTNIIPLMQQIAAGSCLGPSQMPPFGQFGTVWVRELRGSQDSHHEK